MMKLTAVLLVAFVGAAAAADILQAPQPYADEVVIRANVAGGRIATIERFNLDIWADHGDGIIDVRVNKNLLPFLTAQGIDFNVYIPDVAALVAEGEARREAYTGSRDAWFEEYHTYDEQIGYYEELCAENSDVCSMAVVGESYEGRDIYEIVLKSGNPDKAIMLDAGIHAREWISSTTLQYTFTQLLNSSLIADFEWVLLPHLNPDGYVYSWGSGNRMWRKSRNDNAGTSCIGTDLNRNYPTDTWGGAGASSNPCSDTYHGASAGSEPEVATNIDRFNALLDRTEVPLAMTMHAYSQLLLRPYGHTTADAPDEAILFALGAAQCDAIESIHGMAYQNIKSVSLYPTTGTTSDWYYAKSPSNSYAQHTLGYTYELRDTGRYGFLLPEDQIIPQGEEFWAGIIAAANFF